MDNEKLSNEDKGAFRRSFTPEEIKQHAKDFCTVRIMIHADIVDVSYITYTLCYA
jgi:hypothetical protein